MDNLCLDIWRLIIDYLQFNDKKVMREVCKDLHQLVTNNRKLFKPILNINLWHGDVCRKFHHDYAYLTKSTIKIRIIIPLSRIIKKYKLKKKLVDIIDRYNERVEEITIDRFPSKEIVNLALSKLTQLKKITMYSKVNSEQLLECLRKNVGLEYFYLQPQSFHHSSLQKKDLPNLEEAEFSCWKIDSVSFLFKSAAKVSKLTVDNMDLDGIEGFSQCFPYLTECRIFGCTGNRGINFLLSDTARKLTKLTVTHINLDVLETTCFPCLRECEIRSCTGERGINHLLRSPSMTSLTFAGDLANVTDGVNWFEKTELTIDGDDTDLEYPPDISFILNQTGHNLTKLKLYRVNLETLVTANWPNLKDLCIRYVFGQPQLSSLLAQAAESVAKLEIWSFDWTTNVERPLSNLKILIANGLDKCVIGHPLLTKPGTVADLLSTSRKRKLE